MGEASRPHKLVVIGASSGGIEALQTVVQDIPATFPAALVIAQHLDPQHQSHLREILQKHTPLQVRSVAGTMPLEAGTIHVVPANNDVTITDGSVTVQDRSTRRPKPSIDALLATAARGYGENLLAVILTGEGSDGAEGARLVKEAGGTVLIEDPRTARHPSMPLSLSPASVDIVAPVGLIGRMIGDLVVEPDEVVDDGQLFDRFMTRLREQTGIDFRNYKRPTIARRLQRRMAAVGVRSLGEYLEYLAREPEEFTRLASTFLIKVTEFFRDADLFDHLRDEIVPRVIQAAEERDHEVRVWSAGCATGEEAYSIAILFAEVLGNHAGRVNVRIFATDVDDEAVNFARRGVYGASSVATMPKVILERYFTKTGDQFEIDKRIRAMTIFGQHDLGQRAPFPRTDLVVARNVLIYFTPELQKRALQLFAFSLRERGYLVLGKAESVSQLADLFAVEHPKLKIYRRQGERVLIPPSREHWMNAASERPWQADRPGQSGRSARGRPSRDSSHGLAERTESILLRLPIGVVLVNREYDIQLINRTARRLLGIHAAAIGDDLVHVASQLPSPLLRNGIDQALGGTDSTVIHESTDLAGAGSALRITFQSQHLDGRPDAPGAGAVVLVEDVSEVQIRDRDQSLRIGSLETLLAAADRRTEGIAATNRDLLTANEELTLANSELRSANDELLVGSEEVQAATEEVETLNEELQATNEELETLNEELQATIEELNTTNDDLEARSAELVATAGRHDRGRRSAEATVGRLAGWLVEPDAAILVVAPNGRAALMSEGWRRLTDGRSLVPEGSTPPLHGERDVARRVLTGQAVEGTYAVTERGRRRKLRLAGEPLLDSTGAIIGGILALREGRPKAPKR